MNIESALVALAKAPSPVLGCLLLSACVASGAGPTTNPPAKPDRGFAYIHEEVREVPWSIHLVKIKRANTNLELHTTMGGGSTLGMGLVSAQVKTLPPELGRAVAAINGDFYNHGHVCPGDPMGLQIARGELISAPSATHVCFWMDAAGNAHRGNVAPQFRVTWPDGTTAPFGLNEDRADDGIVLYTAAVGRTTRTSPGLDLVLERQGSSEWLPLQIGHTYSARVREVREAGNTPVSRDTLVLSVGPTHPGPVPKLQAGALLRISTATPPDLAGAKVGLGGSPTLVSGGKTAELSDSGRHPRSALGWNKDYIFLVEVDGRQRNVSVGMSLPELAEYMVKLGCEEAMNFDGGGSATLWVFGNVMNSPSEGRERPAANALVLVDRSKSQK